MAAILDLNIIDPLASERYQVDGFDYWNDRELHVPRVSPNEYHHNESTGDSVNGTRMRKVRQKEPTIWGRYNESMMGQEFEGLGEVFKGF